MCVESGIINVGDVGLWGTEVCFGTGIAYFLTLHLAVTPNNNTASYAAGAALLCCLTGYATMDYYTKCKWRVTNMLTYCMYGQGCRLQRLQRSSTDQPSILGAVSIATSKRTQAPCINFTQLSVC